MTGRLEIAFVMAMATPPAVTAHGHAAVRLPVSQAMNPFIRSPHVDA
jgi:hypothetical protein